MLSLETVQPYYSNDDIVHGFDHIERVLALANTIAEKENANWEIVRAAVLLHDAQLIHLRSPEKEIIKNQRLLHQEDSAELAREILNREGWAEKRIEEVIHCIRSHRFRNSPERPSTLEAKVLFDADKLDAIGAVGIARAIAYAAQHGKTFYTPPSEQFCKTGILEAGEQHSAYHEYLYKLVKLIECMFTPTARQMAQERQEFMIHFFNQLKQDCELVNIH